MNTIISKNNALVILLIVTNNNYINYCKRVIWNVLFVLYSVELLSVDRLSNIMQTVISSVLPDLMWYNNQTGYTGSFRYVSYCHCCDSNPIDIAYLVFAHDITVETSVRLRC